MYICVYIYIFIYCDDWQAWRSIWSAQLVAMAPVQRFPGDHLLPQLPAAGWDLPSTPLGSVSGQYLAAFGDVPVDFMFFFEEINANHSFYILYCQIMLNIGVSCKFPIQLQPIRWSWLSWWMLLVSAGYEQTSSSLTWWRAWQKPASKAARKQSLIEV